MGEVVTGWFPERKVTHDSRCPNPCPDLDLTSEHRSHCTEWPEPEHCTHCRAGMKAWRELTAPTQPSKGDDDRDE